MQNQLAWVNMRWGIFDIYFGNGETVWEKSRILITKCSLGIKNMTSF